MHTVSSKRHRSNDVFLHPHGHRLTACGVVAVAGLLLTGLMGAQCNPVPALPTNVNIVIDPSLTSPAAGRTVVSEGQEKPVGVLKSPNGAIETFVLDEVMIRAETREELDAFLERYNGTVIKDGTISELPPDLKVADVERTQWYLVRVDLSTTSLDDLPANVQASGVQGDLVFSSDEAARLTSIVARQAKDGAWANHVLTVDSSFEHPTSLDANGNPNAFLDWESFFWMGETGLSIGVTRAWEYLVYKNVPPTPPPGGSVTFSPTRVAVIDSGFALSTSTGVPLLNNVDYFNSFSAPLQYDQADGDTRAGGASSIKTSAGTTAPWHGQGSFGVCCAAERNQFGGAGTGGPVAQPILIRTSATAYNLADSIYTAGNMGAQVITISMSFEHGILSILADTFWDNRIGDSVIACTNVGAVVLASAGNQGRSLDDDFTLLPCELLHVVCVGSIQRDTTTRHNFGANVAISGPEGVRSTVTPESVAADADNVGADELDEFFGTSCATPFVAGVVALMKALDPSLKRDRVVEILQTTANASSDARVPRGYVDAFRAVLASAPNAPPSIQMTQPLAGQTIGWKNTPRFRTTYSDPEVDATNLNQLLRFPGTVVITSSIDGELCRATAFPYDCTSTRPELTIGQHVITATATDTFGAVATHQITVSVVNRAPRPEIVKPVSSGVFFSHIPVEFVAFVPDSDELITDDQIAWSSDVDGPLGTGQVLLQTLTAGTHTITLTATDGKGLSASQQVVVTVQAGAGFPTPVITSPENGTLFGPGQPATLVGSATDPEDGVLAGARLEWSSDRDGVIGTGNSVTFTPSFVPSSTPGCAGGAQHIITLKATDSDNHVVTVTITLNVGCIF